MNRKKYFDTLQKIGYKQSSAYAIVNGTRSITRAKMKKAKEELNIPYDYWDALPFASQAIPDAGQDNA